MARNTVRHNLVIIVVKIAEMLMIRHQRFNLLLTVHQSHILDETHGRSPTASHQNGCRRRASGDAPQRVLKIEAHSLPIQRLGDFR